VTAVAASAGTSGEGADPLGVLQVDIGAELQVVAYEAQLVVDPAPEPRPSVGCHRALFRCR